MLVDDPIQLLGPCAQGGPLVETPTPARYDSQDNKIGSVWLLFLSSSDFTTVGTAWIIPRMNFYQLSTYKNWNSLYSRWKRR